MVVDLLPCPFCGGRDVSLSSIPDLESRYRVTCNTCRVYIIDDRRDKVHDKWNMRNSIQIGNHTIYLQPPVIDGLYPLSFIQKSFDELVKQLADFVPPPNNDEEAWERARTQMHGIVLRMKQLDISIRTRRNELKKIPHRKKQRRT